MLISKQMAEDLEYYTVTIDSWGINDVFILYFKQWWKLRKIIKIKRIHIDERSTMSSNDSQMLLCQLKYIMQSKWRETENTDTPNE